MKRGVHFPLREPWIKIKEKKPYRAGATDIKCVVPSGWLEGE